MFPIVKIAGESATATPGERTSSPTHPAQLCRGAHLLSGPTIPIPPGTTSPVVTPSSIGPLHNHRERVRPDEDPQLRRDHRAVLEGSRTPKSFVWRPPIGRSRPAIIEHCNRAEACGSSPNRERIIGRRYRAPRRRRRSSCGERLDRAFRRAGFRVISLMWSEQRPSGLWSRSDRQRAGCRRG